MNTEMNLKKLPVGLLKPAKYNPRKDLKPGDPAYEKIKRSLHDFGYVDPVIWNEVTGNIVGGHQRYKVLLAEGVTEIDCVVVHIEDPQDEKALNIALNKAVGEWEPKALAELLTDLQLSGYDLGATGFDAAEVDDLFSQVHDKDVKDDDCELDAEEVTPFVKPGDLWTLGRHRMLCGDATDTGDVARLMDGLKANLVVTDPPYNVSYQSADGKSIQNDSMADEAFYAFLLAAFRNMAAHLAEGGSAYIFHADTEGLNFRRAFKEAGFHISGVCVWVKNSLVLGRSPYQWQHEPVLYGWLPNGKHKWFSDRKQSTVWKFDKPRRSKEHPTMKPIPLLAYPIKNSSAPNGVVMDLFGGSGSTLMACEQTDRVCRTMELDPRYASVIVMRYKSEYSHFLGYRKGDNGLPEIVPEEAETVRWIYSLFLSGKTTSSIAGLLTREGIPTPAGKRKWAASTVESILKNEKYKGDALLQKAFTVDFLTKKQKKNEGEVPQYYVENSHPAIIDPAEWKLVQRELERRKAIGRSYSGNSIFSSRLVCGDCGGYFGSKVWHSTDKYRRTIWRCNSKFTGEEKCQTPHLTEEEIKARFLDAFNMLVADKERLLDECRTMQAALTDTGSLDSEIAALLSEMEVVAELTKRCIEENSTTAQDQTAYLERYNGLAERYETAKAKLEKLQAEKAQREAKAEDIGGFMFELAEYGESLTEFDDRLWLTVIDTVTVHRDGQLAFKFQTGHEMLE